MSPFIVVVVLCACTWVVARAATQPVEPATVAVAPARGRAARRSRTRPEPVGPPPPPPALTGPVLLAEPPAATPVLTPFATPTLAPEFAPPEPEVADPEPEVLTPEPGAGREVAAPGLDPPRVDEADDVEVAEVDEVEVDDVEPAPPKIRRGPRSDPGEPAAPTPTIVRVRSAATLLGIAVALGVAVAASVGLLFVVLFVIVRSAFG